MKVCVFNPHKELTVDGYLFKNPHASIGYNLCKPWCEVYSRARSEGIDFVTFDQVADLNTLDGVVFLDRPSPLDGEANSLMSLSIRKYLVIYECEMISPGNWDPEYHAQFDKIFTWSDVHVDQRRYYKFNLTIDPYPLVPPVDENTFVKRKFLTLIAGAKTAQHPNELYSHRVSAIRWYEQNHPDLFDLYGGGWDAGNFPSYRGRVDDKLQVLTKYNFSICYENATRYPGYVTEKILDCFSALNVPIYGGEQNIRAKIPEQCFIDIRNFKTFDELHAYISGMSCKEYLTYISEINRFFSGPSIKQFSNTEFADEFIKIIKAGQEIRPTIELPAQASPRMIVCVGYGDEQTIFTRAKSVWDFYTSFFSGFDLYFLKADPAVERGEVFIKDGKTIIIGTKGIVIPDRGTDVNLYSKTGVWSKSENFLSIYRQIALYDFLLRRYDGNFHLFQSTVTSVIDFNGLLAVAKRLPAEGCFAGMPNTLDAPRYAEAPMRGLNIVFGTNTLLSRDVVELARTRFSSSDPLTSEPNDVWLSAVLNDIPRQALPFFSYRRFRQEGLHDAFVAESATVLNTQGHFQFRVKTEPVTYPPGVKREDVDPWLMLIIAQSIISGRGEKQYEGFFEHFRAAFEGGSENKIPPRSASHVFTGQKPLRWDDIGLERGSL